MYLDRFLGEIITPRQRQGYLMIAVAVLAILLVAPKSSELGETTHDVLEKCSSTFFIAGFASIFVAQSALIFHILVRGKDSLRYLVSACSLFGAITVTSGKLISVLIRLSTATPTTANDAGAKSTMALKHETEDAADTTISLAILIVMVVAAIGGQEYFKQEALARFPVSTFQPLLFAGFNIAAVLSNVILFKEIQQLPTMVIFLVVFSLAMIGILYGTQLINVETPSTGGDRTD
jgi:hypothetical protein